MKKFKKLITSILLGALTLSVFAFTGCKTSEEQANNDSDVDIAVLTSYESTTQDGQKCLAQEVVATIRGYIDPTKPIDLKWEVYIPEMYDNTLNNSLYGENVNDYVIIEPSKYNEETLSSTCIVKLLQPIEEFERILLKVSCSNNKISRLINITYVPGVHEMGLFLSEEFEVVEDNSFPLDIFDNVILKNEVYLINTNDTIYVELHNADFFGNSILSNDDIGYVREVYVLTAGNILMKEKGVEGAPLIEVDLHKFINYNNLETGFSEYMYCYFNGDSSQLEINFVNKLEELTITACDENGYDCDYEFYGFADSYEPFVVLDFIIDGSVDGALAGHCRLNLRFKPTE